MGNVVALLKLYLGSTIWCVCHVSFRYGNLFTIIISEPLLESCFLAMNSPRIEHVMDNSLNAILTFQKMAD